MQSSPEQAEENYAQNLSRIKEKLQNMAFNLHSADITSIVLASKDSDKIYTSYDLGGGIISYDNRFYRTLKKKKGKLITFGTDFYPHLRTQNVETFAMGRLIIGDDMEEIGYEMIFVSSNFFQELLKNQDVNEEASYYILARDKTPMLVRNSKKVGVKEEDIVKSITEHTEQYFIMNTEEKNVLVTQYKSRYTGWSHISVITLDDVISGIVNTVKRIILISVLFIIMSIFLVHKVVLRITKPIMDMQEVMMKISRGDISLRLPEYRMRDVKYLARNFNKMLDKINLLIQENNRKQRELRVVEFQMLQAQINPHFLYNTLNSIRWLAILNGQKQIKKQIDNLTTLLRSTISDMRTEICLEEEMQVTNCYSEIMRMRYYNFSLFVHMEEGTEKCQMPKFILQPILENAILHGLPESSGEGEIRIFSEKSEDKLKITVTDNGVGMTEAQIEECMNRQGDFNHIGIINVKQRIQMMYGEEYGILIFPEKNKGTRVEIWLPWREERCEVQK